MSSSQSAWIETVVRECKPHEIVECMGDLQDRAEFAEAIARRQILERLVKALNEMPFRDLSDEAREILAELEMVRSL